MPQWVRWAKKMISGHQWHHLECKSTNVLELLPGDSWNLDCSWNSQTSFGDCLSLLLHGEQKRSSGRKGRQLACPAATVWAAFYACIYINCLTCVKMSWVTSTLHCLGWHRPDLCYNCGYCATCKWYSVVVWDWKVPQLHVSEHLAPGNSTVGEVVEPKDTGTARGHMSQALWK